MSRGMLTEEVKSKSKELLGREINLRELRLMPYIDFVLKNGQRIEFRKINDEEKAFMKKLEEEGFIQINGRDLSVTKEFYDAMSNILWIAYVDCKDS